MLGIYYDDPETTAAAELQSDAGVSVVEGVPLPEGLTEKRLPAGRYARLTHIGPYTQLGDAWARLMGEWLPRSGHRVGEGSSFEVYRNTPATASPEQLRTDLYLPIA
jgi:AraC family transcriptional regulator